MALSNMLWASIAALMLVLAATACTAQNLGEAVQEAADRAREGALAAGATDAVADQLARSTGVRLPSYDTRSSAMNVSQCCRCTSKRHTGTWARASDSLPHMSLVHLYI